MADWHTHLKLPLCSPYKAAEVNRLPITASASADTKGDWIEVTASTTFRVDSLCLKILTQATVYTDQLFDIGIGAAGAEVTVLSNLYIGRMNTYSRNYADKIVVPVHIPAGSRIAVRQQGHTGSSITYIEVYCFGGNEFLSMPNQSKITTYGANVSDSGGVTVDPGSTANTLGAYSEITASCENIMSFFFAIGQLLNTARTDAYMHLDIAIGAAGSEVVILPGWTLLADSQLDVITPTYSPIIPISIPSGTRIAARASCSINDATDRLFDLIIYGIG